jgi:hypothetical protein
MNRTSALNCSAAIILGMVPNKNVRGHLKMLPKS